MKKSALSLAVIFCCTATAFALADVDKVAGKEVKQPVSKPWAYQPVQIPAVPAVKQKKWVRSPIDAFILAKLEEKGIKPSDDADRGTYIRRATLDAWGLLPSPDEVKAFESDRSPDAYEKLVDRLLASPHFGERQARRWLDLARYADSDGFDNDTTRPNNYRYRDYVIQAFNQDKPFDRFIREQLAGDELYPDSQEAKIATGFLAGYPENNNSRDLVQRKYLIATDMTDLVGDTFLASTVGCARCHNHKSDKVSQKEYYQLQAFFANTSVIDRARMAKGTETAADIAYVKQVEVYLEATKEIRAKQKAILDQTAAVSANYIKMGYFQNTRDAIFKPEKDWTPMDRWINNRFKTVAVPGEDVAYLRRTALNKNIAAYNPENLPKWREYQHLTEALTKFDALKPPKKGSVYYTTLTELGHPESPPTNIRFAGIAERPLDEVQPGIPALWGGDSIQITPLEKSSGRRSAMANWVASANNPLTARVYVNRVWAQYFSAGIVPTIGDFGRAGQKPTNPELLDYLASEFVKEGWSVKKLQRSILLSSVYRQSSVERESVLKIDPSNKLLAFFPIKRLDAEEIRDSLLYASGNLDETIGGPSVFPPLPANFSAGKFWQASMGEKDNNRRSLYTFTRRSLPYPLTATFDPADASKAHQTRAITTTSLQALTLMNSDIVFGWSQDLAGQVIREAGSDETAQLNRLYEILFSRPPTKQEKVVLKNFLTAQKKIILQRAVAGRFDIVMPSGLKDTDKIDPVKDAAFVDLVHTVVNSNDFAYRF